MRQRINTKNSSNKKIRPLYQQGVFLFFLWFCLIATGCTPPSAPSSTREANKEFSSLVKASTLDRFDKGRQKDYSIRLTTMTENPFSGLKYPPFVRLDPVDETIESNMRGFSFNGHLGLKELNQTALPPEDIHKSLYTNQFRTVSEEDLFQFDDFLPLDHTNPSLEPQMSRFAIWRDEFASQNKGKAVTTPFDDKSGNFNRNTFFYSPLGNVNNTFAIPYALDFFLIAFNTRVLELYKGFITMDPERKDLYAPWTDKGWDELTFKEFLRFLTEHHLRFYYPDFKSSDLKIRKMGMSFLCQMISWLNEDKPELYEKLLHEPNLPEFDKYLNEALSFLKSNSSVFIASGSSKQILDSVTKENIGQQLPKGFDINKPDPDYKLPEDYFSNFASPVSFGYVPESEFLAAYSSAVDRLKNKNMLMEIKRIRDERKKRMMERRKRKSRRSRNSQAEESEEPEEEPQEESDEEEDEEDTAEKIRTGYDQLYSFPLQSMIARRYYLGVPQNAPSKTRSAAFLLGILTIDTQKALTMRDQYLRSIRSDISGELYILKLVEPDIKKSLKMNKRFTEPGFQYQDIMLSRFIPVLNPWYLRYMQHHQLLSR